MTKASLEKATFGAGCFWCVEAVFQRLDGVDSVISGYMGGSAEDANYKAVSTGASGHAEVAEISFDSEKITYEELLRVFWAMHDPTTLNQEGKDQGRQYRSVVFYHDESQKLAVEESILGVAAQAYEDPIVTELARADIFYPAEDRHQNYYNTYPFYGYCKAVISPKISKLRKEFVHLLKNDHIETE